MNTKIAILALILVGFLLYFHSLGNKFVGDDESQITNNPAVHSVVNIPQFFSASTFDNGGQLTGIYYKPLMSSFYAVVYTFFGPNPIAYHFLSLIIHICNSILIFLVLKYFLTKRSSFILSLIFLIHPINSQSVLYISALQDVLFFFFGMTALWLAQSFKSTIFTVIFVMVLLFLSLLSKETGILFFPILIIFKYLFDKELIIPFVISEVLIFGLYVFLRIHAIGLHPEIAPNSPIATLNLFERLINTPAVIVFYFKTFIFPQDLAISWQWTVQKLGPVYFFVPLIIVILLVALSMYLGFVIKKTGSKNFKIYIFFLSILIIGLGFHSQILTLDETVAERWFYMPVMGLLGVIGIFLDKLFSKGTFKLTSILVTVIILLLSIRTYTRANDFKDATTLGNHDVKVSKDAFDIESSLGNAYLLDGDIGLAKEHTERSVDLFPYVTNLNNLGLIYAKLGNRKKAEDLYRQAIAIAPFYLPYQNLSAMMTAFGDQKEAEKFTLNALNRFPNNAKLWLYLSIAEYNQRKLNQAKVAIENAYFLDSTEPILGIYQSLENNQPINVKFSY